MADTGDGGNPASSRPKPTTKQDFRDKGAIEQPDDGENAKKLGEKCLTCIKYGSSCAGSSVKDGKCQSCRGIGVGIDPKTGQLRKRALRNCLWVDPDNGLFTYDQAHSHHNLPKNKHNTKAEIAKREPKEEYPALPDYDSTDDEAETESIFQLLGNTSAERFIGPIMADAFDNNLITNDSRLNIENVMDITRREYALAATNPSISTEDLRRKILGWLNEIYSLLDAMRISGEALSRDAIRGMLPNDHAAKLFH